MNSISVVIPVYGCGECLDELYERLTRSLSIITNEYEIILVNDASPDNSWESIKQIALKDPHVKGINFSRNFGQHTAISAGIDYADGDWIVIMDCDLQDEPEFIEQLYNKTKEGFDIVLAKRRIRYDNFFKKAFSKIFYWIFNFLTDTSIDPSIGAFRIISRKVAEKFRKMPEKNRFFVGMINWLGFETALVETVHAKRLKGKTSYNLNKLMGLAFNAIISFSDKPIRISVQIGLVFVIVSFMYALLLIFRKLVYQVPMGWTSIVVSLFLIGGLILVNLGLLGLYIGRIFDEVKNRPIYIIKDSVNIEKEVQSSIGK